MKPNFDNFVEKVEILHTKKELDDWIKTCYEQCTWSQKIRIWIFSKFFKNKICKFETN